MPGRSPSEGGAEEPDPSDLDPPEPSLPRRPHGDERGVPQAGPPVTLVDRSPPAASPYEQSPWDPSARHGPRSADEALIGVALTTQWMLVTGRRLRQDPTLHDLDLDELIDFWADDHQGGPGDQLTPVSGSRSQAR